MCLAIEIHSNLIFLLIIDRKTINDLIISSNVNRITVDYLQSM